MFQALLLGLALSSAVAAPSDRPDVLVIVADDVADSDLDAVPTPNLDALADRGIRFRRAYSHPWCSPTRYSLALARWNGRGSGPSCSTPGPSSPPIRSVHVQRGEFSIAKMMNVAGYETGRFGKWHMGANLVGPWEITPHLHGWEAQRAGIPQSVSSCGGEGYDNWMRVDNGRLRRERTFSAIAVRDAALDWWQLSRPDDPPRFGWISFQLAHSPYVLPPASILPASYVHPSNPTSRDDFESMIVAIDFIVGEIVSVVHPDTWILFVGDNGTPADVVRADQDPLKVKHSTFEDGVRVPFIVAGPGVPRSVRGKQSHSLIHVVDVLPTISEIAGVSRQVPVDGVSFAHLLRRPHAAPLRPFVYCEDAEEDDRSVIEERYKLRRKAGVLELYDLELDPREERPLDPRDAEYERTLARLLPLLDDPSSWRPRKGGRG